LFLKYIYNTNIKWYLNQLNLFSKFNLPNLKYLFNFYFSCINTLFISNNIIELNYIILDDTDFSYWNYDLSNLIKFFSAYSLDISIYFFKHLSDLIKELFILTPSYIRVGGKYASDSIKNNFDNSTTLLYKSSEDNFNSPIDNANSGNNPEQSSVQNPSFSSRAPASSSNTIPPVIDTSITWGVLVPKADTSQISKVYTYHVSTIA
jgi:hypothetical protein